MPSLFVLACAIALGIATPGHAPHWPWPTDLTPWLDLSPALALPPHWAVTRLWVYPSHRHWACWVLQDRPWLVRAEPRRPHSHPGHPAPVGAAGPCCALAATQVKPWAPFRHSQCLEIYIFPSFYNVVGYFRCSDFPTIELTKFRIY